MRQGADGCAGHIDDQAPCRSPQAIQEPTVSPRGGGMPARGQRDTGRLPPWARGTGRGAPRDPSSPFPDGVKPTSSSPRTGHSRTAPRVLAQFLSPAGSSSWYKPSFTSASALRETESSTASCRAAPRARRSIVLDWQGSQYHSGRHRSDDARASDSVLIRGVAAARDSFGRGVEGAARDVVVSWVAGRRVRTGMPRRGVHRRSCTGSRGIAVRGC